LRAFAKRDDFAACVGGGLLRQKSKSVQSSHRAAPTYRFMPGTPKNWRSFPNWRSGDGSMPTE
jgi:hypothetical protein